MNNKRRKEIKELVRDFNYLKGRLERVTDDEEYSFDNMPENLQGSMRGSDSEEAIDILNDAKENLDEVIDLLSQIQGV